MDLDDFIIAVFCVVDEAIPAVLGEQQLRHRGPTPTLADSEVVTMEMVGEYLGLEQDSALFAFFRRHYAHFFPALHTLHRTTFVRQAANLWRLKELLWQSLLDQVPHDPTFAIIDSFPLPVCQFARAYRCRRFRGEAAFGKDTLVRQTFYGMRVHVRGEWPGVITRVCVAPANLHELAVLPGLTEQTQPADRRPQLLVAQNCRRMAAARRRGAGTLLLGQARPAPALERLAQSRSLPH